MIFDCRGQTGDGDRGAGPNGGQGGISVVETNVASVSSISLFIAHSIVFFQKGMVFVPEDPTKLD